jgi:hypothetical protein
LKIIETFIWQCVFVILLIVSKFLVMKAEHTVAPLQNSDITRKILTVYSTVIKTNFSVDILQWMKHGCLTTLQDLIYSHPSGVNAKNRIQSVERRNGQLARLCHQFECAWYYIHWLPRKGPDHQQLVLNSVIGAFKRRNQEKTAPWKCCFIKTMHCVTSQSKRRQNCVN